MELALKGGLWGGGLLVVVLFLVIVFFVLVWWCANEVCHPSKRELRDYAAGYLDGSAEAGFSIERFVSSDGMPCLVCTPEVVEVFSERAEILRDELLEKGYELGGGGEVVGTVLILHGRQGRKENYLAVAERFCGVGLRCVIPDLPGHGDNASRYTTYGVLEGEVVLRCYEECAERFGFSGGRCGVFGQSMGGSVAVHTAGQVAAPFDAMVIVASFDRLVHVVERQTNDMLSPVLGPMVRVAADYVMAWMSGVKISEVSPVRVGPRVSIPTLFAHGDADTRVPSSLGRALYDAFPEDSGKGWVTVPGANHHDVMITDFPLYAEMAGWFLKNFKQR